MSSNGSWCYYTDSFYIAGGRAVDGLAPLHLSLGAIGVIFTYFLWGPFALMAIPANTLGVMQNFILSAIPLFIFMGLVLQKSGLANALYDTVHKWPVGCAGAWPWERW